MSEQPRPDESRALVVRVLNATTPAEQVILYQWIRELVTVRDADSSSAVKAFKALRITLASKALWPLVKVIAAEAKRIGWDERSSKWKAFLVGSSAGLVLFGSHAAGIAALGGAIGVPLWLVLGGGAVVLDAFIDAEKKGPR